MTNIYLAKLAAMSEVNKSTAKTVGEIETIGGGLSVAGGVAGGLIGKKIGGKGMFGLGSAGVGALVGSHVLSGVAEAGIIHHNMKQLKGNLEKKSESDKLSKFKMPKDRPTIATKEELLDKIQDNLLKRDKIRADQETQVWKETKRTNDIKDKEVGKMDKLKIVADVTKEKIKAKAKAKGAKK